MVAQTTRAHCARLARAAQERRDQAREEERREQERREETRRDVLALADEEDTYFCAVKLGRQ